MARLQRIGKRAKKVYRAQRKQWEHQYLLYWQPRLRLYLLRETPIVIYQMGKVGSASVLAAIREMTPAVYHVHSTNPDYIAMRQQKFLAKGLNPIRGNHVYGQFIREHIIKPDRPVKYITLVREPISRNISSFFQGYRLIGDQTHPTEETDSATLTQQFLEHFEHERPLTFFDVEFRDMVGIDVYAEPFPHEQGYIQLQHGNAQLLLMKMEVDAAVKNAALAEFLGIPTMELPYANVGDDKAYASVYARFKRDLVLPQEYIERMLESRYARHFYTDAERDKIRHKWMQRSG